MEVLRSVNVLQQVVKGRNNGLVDILKDHVVDCPNFSLNHLSRSTLCKTSSDE